MPAPEMSLIIPAFNESSRLAEGVRRLEAAASEGRVDLATCEVLFVDDGSIDNTAEVAEEIAAGLPLARVVRQPENRGKGAAVRAGVRSARGRRILFTDADLAIDPRQIPALLAGLELAPVAVGSRVIGGHIEYGSWIRTRAGRSFNLLVRTLSNIELRDTQCGFKAARTAHAKVLFHHTTIDGFAFDVEFLSRARGLNWPVEEVPVSWRDVPGSHVDIARHSAVMLRDLAQARLRHRELPALLGLDVNPILSLAEVGAACAGTSLEAAPVLEAADGKFTVLAALHSPAEASPALLGLRNRLGSGEVRKVIGTQLRAAKGLEAALAP